MERKTYEWGLIRNVLTTISSDKQVDIFDVPESTAHSTLVRKLIVTDDKDDSGTDDVTVEAEQIPQDESNSECELLWFSILSLIENLDGR